MSLPDLKKSFEQSVEQNKKADALRREQKFAEQIYRETAGQAGLSPAAASRALKETGPDGVRELLADTPYNDLFTTVHRIELKRFFTGDFRKSRLWKEFLQCRRSSPEGASLAFRTVRMFKQPWVLTTELPVRAHAGLARIIIPLPENRDEALQLVPLSTFFVEMQ